MWLLKYFLVFALVASWIPEKIDSTLEDSFSASKVSLDYESDEEEQEEEENEELAA